jgi:hypothetical protein
MTTHQHDKNPESKTLGSVYLALRLMTLFTVFMPLTISLQICWPLSTVLIYPHLTHTIYRLNLAYLQPIYTPDVRPPATL